ncbi:MAG: 30S ribosomal protein S8 [Nanoarchaeota archaeon]|nr:30S ribosomal protein S8 [Nanoarchaeota archaeon]
MYIDLLTKIKNAQSVGKRSLKTRFSKQDKAVAEILSRHGYVGAVEVKGRPSKRFIFVGLQGKRPVEGCKFLSKPSLREYTGYRDLYRVKGGHGILLVSTPKGVMEGREAKKEKVGGELLFKIW